MPSPPTPQKIGTPATALAASLWPIALELALTSLLCVILPHHKPAAKRVAKAITKHTTKG